MLHIGTNVNELVVSIDLVFWWLRNRWQQESCGVPRQKSMASLPLLRCGAARITGV
jgi:hypothetical protein